MFLRLDTTHSPAMYATCFFADVTSHSQYVFCFVNVRLCSSNTHRPLSSSFLGVPYRILNINHKKELLRGL